MKFKIVHLVENLEVNCKFCYKPYMDIFRDDEIFVRNSSDFKYIIVHDERISCQDPLAKVLEVHKS